MHSYREMPDGKRWAVVFEYGVAGFRMLAAFDKEDDAASFANYLNGGDGNRMPISILMHIRDEQEKRRGPSETK